MRFKCPKWLTAQGLISSRQVAAAISEREWFFASLALRLFSLVIIFLLAPSANLRAEAKVTLVKDLNTSGRYLRIISTCTSSSAKFLIADDGEHGAELWITDGGADGTKLVKDIHSGPIGAFEELSQPCLSIGSSLYFVADDGLHGPELWKSDGTLEGTLLVGDFMPATSASYQIVLVGVLRNKILFSIIDSNGQSSLWSSDGTMEGSAIIANVAAKRAVLFVDSLLFVGSTPLSGTELWRTDGTLSGTYQLKDIFPGSEGSYPQELEISESSVFFTATDPSHGNELWRTDGTPDGTVLVKDIQPGTIGSFPAYVTYAGGSLFFSADDGQHGRELWQSDGSESGTILYDLTAGSAGSVIAFILRAGFGPIIGSNISQGSILLGMNETREIVPFHQLQSDLLNPVTSPENYEGESLAFFQVSQGIADPDGSIREVLWRSDGTASGTFCVTPLFPTDSAAYPNTSIWLGNLFLFAGANDSTGWKLWATDGSVTGTRPLANPDGSTPYFQPFPSSLETPLFALGDLVLALTVTGERLVTNGTPEGTAPIRVPLSENVSADSDPELIGVLDKTLIFTATDGIHGRELWSSDGTEQGTFLLKEIVTGPLGVASCEKHPSIVLNGVLYFSLDTPADGTQLWRSDGTTTGTFSLSNLTSQPENFAILGSLILFNTKDHKLYSTDGTSSGTIAIKNGSSGELVLYQGQVYFSGRDAQHGYELWKTDGTAAGTVMVKDIQEGTGHGVGNGLSQAVLNNKLFFAANDGIHGYELWQSDGTSDGTTMFLDLNLMAQEGQEGHNSGSLPVNLALSNGKLFFSAYDGIHGLAVWVSDGNAAGTSPLIVAPQGEVARCGQSYTSLGSLTLFSLGHGECDSSQAARTVWISDGTVAGTQVVNAFEEGGPLSPSDPPQFVELLGLAFLSASSGSKSNIEAWVTEGNGAQAKIMELWPGKNGSSPSQFTKANDRVFFVASDPAKGRELFLAVVDQCPNDPGKITPGICGCGISDEELGADSNANGIPDCLEEPTSSPPHISLPDPLPRPQVKVVRRKVTISLLPVDQALYEISLSYKSPKRFLKKRKPKIIVKRSNYPVVVLKNARIGRWTVSYRVLQIGAVEVNTLQSSETKFRVRGKRQH